MKVFANLVLILNDYSELNLKFSGGKFYKLHVLLLSDSLPNEAGNWKKSRVVLWKIFKSKTMKKWPEK